MVVDPANLVAITDPRDGSVVGSVPITPAGEIDDVVARSRQAAATWSRQAPAEWGAHVRCCGEALRARSHDLAECNARETGRPFDEALAGVEAGIGTLLQYAELGPLHRGRSLQGSFGATDLAVHEPRGVVVALTPWNDPVAIACGLLGAAIVTGNTVVHKPSERCPHLGIMLGETMAAELPSDVLLTVSGDGTTGRELVSRPGIDLIAHVGSTATGRDIELVAASTDTEVLRENGGNDALVVDADVDPAWAAGQAALGAFANSGQICTSVERILVHADVAAEFTAQLVAEARRRNTANEVAPLVDERMRAAVDAHVTQAVAGGATVLTGGTVPSGPGSWYPATVLTGLRPEMDVMHEETFGPIAAIHVVPDFDTALELAADDAYGLSATVLSRSLDHIQRAVAELPVGTVKINAVFGGAPGGSAEPRRASGRGFGYGPELLDEMTLTKVVHISPAPAPAS